MYYPELKIIITLFSLVITYPTIGKLIRFFMLTKNTVQAFDSNNKHILKSYESLKNEIFSLKSEVKILKKNPDKPSSFYQIKPKQIIFLLFFITISFFIFILLFGDEKSVYEKQIWIDSATFINNFFTPIILTITLFVIYKTWQTSKSELEDTRKELIKTREIQNVSFTIDLLRQRLSDFNSHLNETVNEVGIKNGCLLILRHSEIEKTTEQLVCDINQEIDENESNLISKKYLKKNILKKLEYLHRNVKYVEMLDSDQEKVIQDVFKYKESSRLHDILYLEHGSFSDVRIYILLRLITLKDFRFITLLQKATKINHWINAIDDAELKKACKEELLYLADIKVFNSCIMLYELYQIYCEQKSRIELLHIYD